MHRQVFIFHLTLFISIAFVASKNNSCPTLDDFLNRSPYLADFNPYSYQGTWYELAFYDYTQFPKTCGCTHLNWTILDKNSYSDDFITTCPYEIVWLRKNYTIHMNGTIHNKPYSFFIPETGFHVQFNNTIVYYRKNQTNDDYYDRAIQYQCKIDDLGTRIFTGINFLSRTYFNSDSQRKQAINEMIKEALYVGIEKEYLDDIKIVQWNNC